MGLADKQVIGPLSICDRDQIEEVVYAKPQSRVRLGLVAFQDYEWPPIDRFSLSLDTSNNWLRSSYSYQGKRESTSPVVVWHNAQFGLILAAKGRHEIVGLNAFREHQSILAKHRNA